MEQLILVDNKDNQVGLAEKMLVHQSGMLHRAFSIFVFRKHQDSLQLLLQKRHSDKYHSGGLWTNSCCGHPSNGETIVSAAKRRLTEELGIHIDLDYLNYFIYKHTFINNLTEHELDHVLVGLYKDDQEIIPNPVEIEDFKWIDLATLEQELLNFKEQFTVWLPLAYNIIKNNLKNLWL